MPKIYEALKAAEKERAEGGSGGSATTPQRGKAGRGLREKLISVYQAVCTEVPEQRTRTLLFIGAQNGEGTSTTVREFARVVAAELGHRVLLIDADQGFGGHAEFFGVTHETALSEVAESGRYETAISGTDEPTLFVAQLAPRGVPVSKLTAQTDFSGIFDALREDFEFLLVDVPPISDSSDALLVVREVDGVVMVIEAERTRWQVARQLRDRLEKQGGRVLGVVLNKRRFYIPRAIYRRL